MPVTRAQLLEAVQNEPHGVTTAILAERFGATRYNVSGALSKLAAYGYIRKSEVHRNGNRTIGCLWLPKAQP